VLSVTSSQTFCSVMQSAATAVERSVMLSGACIANRSSAATNALRLLVLVDVDDAMILISMKCLFVQVQVVDGVLCVATPSCQGQGRSRQWPG